MGRSPSALPWGPQRPGGRSAQGRAASAAAGSRPRSPQRPGPWMHWARADARTLRLTASPVSPGHSHPCQDAWLPSVPRSPLHPHLPAPAEDSWREGPITATLGQATGPLLESRGSHARRVGGPCQASHQQRGLQPGVPPTPVAAGTTKPGPCLSDRYRDIGFQAAMRPG